VPRTKIEKTKKKKRGIAQVLTIIDGLSRTPFRNSDRIGFEAEDEILKLAKNFQNKKIIKKVKLFERFSPEDKIGRDFMIELLTGKIIYIQVTATYHREDEVKARKQGIFYLPVYSWEDNRITKEKLRMIILDSYFGDLPLWRLGVILKQLSSPEKKPKKFWRFPWKKTG